MDIKDLESVLAIYRYKSFSEAAYQTNFSLSAISKQVSRVEKEFGVKLFERKTKGNEMSLTSIGEQIMPTVERLLMEYDNLEWQIENSKSNKKKALAIGYVPLIGTIGCRKVLSDFAVRYPETEMSQVLMFRSDLLRLLLMGKLDGIFLLFMGNYEGNRDAWETLSNNELGIIPTMVNRTLWLGISASHPLASREAIDLRDLKKETFIFSSAQNPVFYSTRVKSIAELSGVPEEKLKTRFIDFIRRDVVLDVVASGKGVLPLTCMPPKERSDVRFLPVEGWNMEATGVFAYRKNNVSRSLKEFVRCVERYVENSDV